MRIKYESAESNPHQVFFAWMPIQIGDEWVWLENVKKTWVPPCEQRHAEHRLGQITGFWMYSLIIPELMA